MSCFQEGTPARRPFDLHSLLSQSENYGQALRDTSSVLKSNPKSVKAFFRGAKALLAINKTTEALDCCDHALLLDEKNAEVKKLRQKIVEREIEVKRVETIKTERERRRKEGTLSVQRALLVSSKKRKFIEPYNLTDWPLYPSIYSI